MDQLLASAPEWVVMLCLVLAIFTLIGKSLSEASETWAGLLGPLGRRWRERGKARQAERAANRLERRYELEDRDYQIEYLGAQLAKCRSENEFKEEFFVYDTRWHRQVALRAAEAECDLPEWKTYSRWKADRGD